MRRLCPFLSEKHPFYTLENQTHIPMVFTSYQHIFFQRCLDKKSSKKELSARQHRHRQVPLFSTRDREATSQHPQSPPYGP